MTLLLTLYLNAFWFSFAVIGGAILLALWKAKRQIRLPAVWRFLAGTHPLVVLLVCFGAGMAVFVPFFIPAFLWQWPVVLAAWVYAALVVVALVWLGWHWRIIYLWLQRAWRQRKRYWWVWLAGGGLLLAVDAAVAVYVGGPLASDAYVHMAKINQLADGGIFTIADPMLGNGVVESRYHINIVLALHALAAHIVDIPAVDAWRLSLSFWRFLIWTSLFSLSWVFIGDKLRRQWSYGVLMLSPILYATLLFCADYPDRAVIAWVALLLIGLTLLLEKQSAILVLLAALLIAATHPLMAVITIGFLIALAVVLKLLRLIQRKQLWVLALTTSILALPVIFTYSFPNRMSQSVVDYVVQLEYRHFGPFVLAVSVHDQPANWWVWLFMLVGSVVGCLYLIRKASSKVVRVMLILLFTYYYLIIWNPLLLGIIEVHVPPWVIQRFQEMDIFKLITPIIGLFAIASWVGRRIQHRRAGIAAMCIVIVGLLYSAIPGVTNYISYSSWFDDEYAKYLNLSSLKADLQGQRILADPNLPPQAVPVVLRTNIFSLSEQNASPMANIDRRLRCVKVLTGSLRIVDLRAAGISRVLVVNTSGTDFASLAANNPRLKKLNQQGRYVVYAVPHYVSPEVPDAACRIPFGE